jgi:hypothetical protein
MSNTWVSYQKEELLTLHEDDDEVRFVLDQHAEVDLYSASSLKQQSWVDMSLYSETLFWFWANQSLLFLLNDVCWIGVKQ